MSLKGSAKDAVLKYLQLQNRPYSSNDITLNLHKEFGKTAIQKALDELVANELIHEKVYGKQKVYGALQEVSDMANMETELAELDRELETVSQKLKSAEQELKLNEMVLKDLQNQMTTETASIEKANLEMSVKVLKDKLTVLSNTTVKISSKDKESVVKNNEKYMKEYRKRKRICMDIANSILENYPKPKKTFFEEAGIETDEEVGCKL